MRTLSCTAGLLALAASGLPATGGAVDVADADDLAGICRRTQLPTRALEVPWLHGPGCEDRADREEGNGRPEGLEPGVGEPPAGAAEVTAAVAADCAAPGRTVQAIAAHRFAVERAALLLENHRVAVPAASYPLLPYDDQAETLAVAVTDGFELFGGSWSLDIVSDEPLAFALSASQAADLEQRWALDSLTLRLTFELPWSTDTSGEYCHHDPAGASTLQAHPLRAELVDALTGEVLARSRTPFDVAAAMRVDEAAGDPPQPAVRVTSLEVISGGDGDALDLEMVRLAIEFGLLECYLRGLATNARLQGAMVFVLDAGALESSAPPVVTIDALGCGVVSACAVDALSRMPWPAICGHIPPSDTQLRATVVFDR